jgi:hypothetical protein
MRIRGFEGDSIEGMISGIESDGGPKTKFNPNAQPNTLDLLVERDGDVHLTIRGPECPRGITVELNDVRGGAEYPVFARRLRLAMFEIVKELREEGLR